MSGKTYIEKRNLLKTLPEQAIIPVKIRGVENDSSFNELEDGYILLENFPAANGQLTADELAAVQNANEPTEENPFATVADISESGDFINRLGTTNLDPADPASIVLTDGDNVVTVSWTGSQYLMMAEDTVVGSMGRVRLNSNGSMVIDANDGAFATTYSFENNSMLLDSDNPDYYLSGGADFSTNNTLPTAYLQRLATQNNTAQRSAPSSGATVVWDGISDFIFIDNDALLATLTIDLSTNATYDRAVRIRSRGGVTALTLTTTGFTLSGTLSSLTALLSFAVYVDVTNSSIDVL